MSIMTCDQHGSWDSDFHEECPRCIIERCGAELNPTPKEYRNKIRALENPIGWCRNCEAATQHSKRGYDLCCDRCHFIAFVFHDAIDAQRADLRDDHTDDCWKHEHPELCPHCSGSGISNYAEFADVPCTICKGTGEKP